MTHWNILYHKHTPWSGTFSQTWVPWQCHVALWSLYIHSLWCWKYTECKKTIHWRYLLNWQFINYIEVLLIVGNIQVSIRSFNIWGLCNVPRIMSSDLESCTDITIKVVFNLTLADIRISSKDLRKEAIHHYDGSTSRINSEYNLKTCL